MLVLNPAGTEPLLLTGANDAQLFAYSVSRFQTVSLLPVNPSPSPPPPHRALYAVKKACLPMKALTFVFCSPWAGLVVQQNCILLFDAFQGGYS